MSGIMVSSHVDSDTTIKKYLNVETDALNTLHLMLYYIVVLAPCTCTHSRNSCSECIWCLEFIRCTESPFSIQKFNARFSFTPVEWPLQFSLFCSTTELWWNLPTTVSNYNCRAVVVREEEREMEKKRFFIVTFFGSIFYANTIFVLCFRVLIYCVIIYDKKHIFYHLS